MSLWKSSDEWCLRLNLPSLPNAHLSNNSLCSLGNGKYWFSTNNTPNQRTHPPTLAKSKQTKKARTSQTYVGQRLLQLIRGCVLLTQTKKLLWSVVVVCMFHCGHSCQQASGRMWLPIWILDYFFGSDVKGVGVPFARGSSFPKERQKQAFFILILVVIPLLISVIIGLGSLFLCFPVSIRLHSSINSLCKIPAQHSQAHVSSSGSNPLCGNIGDSDLPGLMRSSGLINWLF